MPGDDGTIEPLRGDYTAQVRVALADPADTLDWVRLVVGGSVYGLLGTDANGRDLAEGLAFGLPVALLIGLAAATVSTAIGTGLGLLSGYKGGRVDLVIQRTADVVNNVPLLPLLIFFVFILGAHLWLILLLLVAFSWPGLTILVRSMVLGLSGSQEVEAARALGASTSHILRRHIFPHTAPYVFTQLIFFVPAVDPGGGRPVLPGPGRPDAADLGPDPGGRLPHRRRLPGLLVVGGLPWPAHRHHGHDLHAPGAGHGAGRQPPPEARVMTVQEPLTSSMWRSPMPSSAAPWGARQGRHSWPDVTPGSVSPGPPEIGARHRRLTPDVHAQTPRDGALSRHPGADPEALGRPEGGLTPPRLPFGSESADWGDA